MNHDAARSGHRLTLAATPTLADAVSDALREAILSGRFAPGARLVEANIARELQVSRGSVREALGVLAKEGLVVTIPRHGKFVQPLDATTIDEVYSLRTVLEPFAIERVIERASEDTHRQLREAFDAIVQAVNGRDRMVVAHEDIAFHEAIFVLADHARLRRVWTDIRGTLQIMFNVTTATHLSLADAVDQHQAILDVVMVGNAALARLIIEEHIRLAWERARTAMLQAQVASP